MRQRGRFWFSVLSLLFVASFLSACGAVVEEAIAAIVAVVAIPPRRPQSHSL